MRPHVGQYFQPSSSSALHAGHWITVTFCPQWGQKVIARPAGNSPPQYRQPPAAGDARRGAPDSDGFVGAGGDTGGAGRTGTAPI